MATQKIAGSKPATTPASLAPPSNSERVADLVDEFFDDAEQLMAEAPLAADRATVLSPPTTPEPKHPRNKFFATPDKSDGSSAPVTPNKDPWFNDSAGSSAASSTQVTPLKKSGGAAEFETPVHVKPVRAILREEDVRYNLIRDQSAQLQRGLEALEEVPSPKHSELIAEFRGALVDNFNRNVGSLTPIESPSVKKKLFAPQPSAEKPADWVNSAKAALGISFVNKAHITTFNGTGKHTCPPGDPLDKDIFHRRINPETGIWCGLIKEKSKYSTFAPRQMTDDAFLSLIPLVTEDKNLIAKGVSKAIYFVPNQTWVMEVLYEKKDIASAYPLFHFEKYTGQKELKIEINYQYMLDDLITLQVFERPYEHLLKLVRALEEDAEPIQYSSGEYLIIDIGMLIGENDRYGSCPIPRGILVAFPKK